MRKHTISIRDRRATVDDRLLVSGTWRADCVALDLDAEWEGMDVSVAFEGAGYRIEPPAEPDGTYVVPWECVSGAGGVTVSVRGTDGRQTLAHVVMDRPLVTEPGGVHGEPGATDPTLTEYQRAYRGAVEATGRADEAARGADASRDRADAAEVARAGAEADRVAAELQRAGGEAARAGAEDARESAERGRASAEQGRAESEESRASAETDRESVETERVTAEAERGRAEDGRKAKEAERASAEAERKSTEDARKGAETARAKAEQARAEAEAARVSAEAARENRLENAVGESRRKYITEVGITTLDPNQAAAASIEQKRSNAKLNLSIPKGAKGDKGVDGVRPLSGMGVVVDDAGHCDIDAPGFFDNCKIWGTVTGTVEGGTGAAQALILPYGLLITEAHAAIADTVEGGERTLFTFLTPFEPCVETSVRTSCFTDSRGVCYETAAHFAKGGTVRLGIKVKKTGSVDIRLPQGSLCGFFIPYLGGGTVNILVDAGFRVVKATGETGEATWDGERLTASSIVNSWSGTGAFFTVGHSGCMTLKGVDKGTSIILPYKHVSSTLNKYWTERLGRDAFAISPESYSDGKTELMVNRGDEIGLCLGPGSYSMPLQLVYQGSGGQSAAVTIPEL